MLLSHGEINFLLGHSRSKTVDIVQVLDQVNAIKLRSNRSVIKLKGIFNTVLSKARWCSNQTTLKEGFLIDNTKGNYKRGVFNWITEIEVIK